MIARNPDRPQHVNEYILLRQVRHAVYLQHMANSEVRAVMSLLNRQVLPDITEHIQSRLNRIAAGQLRITFADRRMQELYRAVKSILDSGMKTVGDMLRGRLTAIAHMEADFQIALLRGAITVPFDFVAPAPALLGAIVQGRPYVGLDLNGWLANLSTSSQKAIISRINVGLVEGQSIPQIVRGVRGSREAAFGDGTLDEIRRNAEAVVRTAASGASTGAREATYEANADLIKGVQWVATLDERTCESCGGLDGEVFDMDRGPRPPAHFNCRCTTTPVLVSWKDMGIPAKELEPSTRASMDGQVPETLTYGAWLRTQPAHVQDDALGPTRAALFREGKADIKAFTDDRGRLLTLAELRTKEGIGK